MLLGFDPLPSGIYMLHVRDGGLVGLWFDVIDSVVPLAVSSAEGLGTPMGG